VCIYDVVQIMSRWSSSFPTFRRCLVVLTAFEAMSFLVLTRSLIFDWPSKFMSKALNRVPVSLTESLL